MAKKIPKLVLVDGNALIHRAFHALPLLTTKNGELVNAVYGFATTLLKVIKDINPDYCAVSFDLAAPTFRHLEYKEYKANRVKADQSLYDQIPRVKELVAALNIPIYEKEGFEADDIIGTISSQATQQNIETIIVTGDLDTLQLVNHLIKVYTMKKGLTDTVIYDGDAVYDRYGLTPKQFIDYKALRGDTSDNIPGIPGIGEKGATNLLNKYNSIDGIFSHLDELPERIRQSLDNNQEQLQLNKKLVSIVLDVPIEFIPKKCLIEDYDREKAVKLFQDLEFKSLLPRLPSAKTQILSQGDLFQTIEKTDQKVSSITFKDHLVTSEKQLDDLTQKLSKAKNFAFDTESDFLHGILIGISICFDDKSAYYVPVNHRSCGPRTCLEEKLVLEKIRPFFEKPDILKIAHNLKYDYTILRHEGLNLFGPFFDTMIASYILNPGSRSHSLDNLSFIELGHEKISITALIGQNKKGSMSDSKLEDISRYSCEDAYCTFQLWKKFSPEIDKKNLKELFYDLEMPLVAILADMEITGVKIDIPYLQELDLKLKNRLAEIEKSIYQKSGATFNIGSPKQLSEVLFDKLKLSATDIKKGKTGLSTAAGELEKLKGAHPVIPLILEHRELSKLLNTYVEALPKLTDSASRIHTSYNQTITSTGRLSSSDPNLQNIPIRTDLGKEIRRSFITETDFTLIAADYSQIELRVMAHISQDKAMIDAFNSDRDIHAETSARLNIDRRMAKVVNFSIIYGTSPYGLARALEIDQHLAKKLIDNYFTTYPGVAKYMTEIVFFAKQKGYVETIFGRRRYIPEIFSSNAVIRNSAERAAINMPVQGTAADIMKLAMIKIDQYLQTLPTGQANLLLQVHDELVVEAKNKYLNDVAKNMKQIMESAYQLDVPIIVELESGPNWRDMELI